MIHTSILTIYQRKNYAKQATTTKNKPRRFSKVKTEKYDKEPKKQNKNSAKKRFPYLLIDKKN